MPHALDDERRNLHIPGFRANGQKAHMNLDGSTKQICFIICQFRFEIDRSLKNLIETGGVLDATTLRSLATLIADTDDADIRIHLADVAKQ